jgi:hypothetical protein
MQQQAQQIQMEFQQSQTNALNAQAAESQARAGKYGIETDLAPKEVEISKINALNKNLAVGNEDDKEFERRLRVAEVLLKEAELDNKKFEGEANRQSKKQEKELLSSLMEEPEAPPSGGPTGPRGPNVGPAPEAL